MNGWQTAAMVVAVLMLAEGAALFFVREEAWKSLRDYLAKMTAGQVRMLGVIMIVCGAALLVSALLL